MVAIFILCFVYFFFVVDCHENNRNYEGVGTILGIAFLLLLLFSNLVTVFT